MIREPEKDVRPSRFDGFLNVVERMTTRLTLTLTTTKEPGIILVKNDITGRTYRVDLSTVDVIPAKRLEVILAGGVIIGDEAEAVRELVARSTGSGPAEAGK